MTWGVVDGICDCECVGLRKWNGLLMMLSLLSWAVCSAEGDANAVHVCADVKCNCARRHRHVQRVRPDSSRCSPRAALGDDFPLFDATGVRICVPFCDGQVFSKVDCTYYPYSSIATSTMELVSGGIPDDTIMAQPIANIAEAASCTDSNYERFEFTGNGACPCGACFLTTFGAVRYDGLE